MHPKVERRPDSTRIKRLRVVTSELLRGDAVAHARGLRLVAGLANVNHERQPNAPCEIDLRSEGAALRGAWRDISIVVQAALADGHHARSPGQAFNPQWLATIAVDVVAFSALQFLQGGNINYTPLFALPILLAAVLGTLPLAMGTAATVTLLLLTDAWWMSVAMPADTTPRFLQAALTGSGLFIVALLAHQLAVRLTREEALAQRHAAEARIQTRVNQLVIENLNDGVLVVDSQGRVRAANPAARGGAPRDPPPRCSRRSRSLRASPARPPGPHRSSDRTVRRVAPRPSRRPPPCRPRALVPPEAPWPSSAARRQICCPLLYPQARMPRAPPCF